MKSKQRTRQLNRVREVVPTDASRLWCANARTIVHASLVHASLGALRPESLHFSAALRIRQVAVSGCLVILQMLELA
jgi:hypothetical protein